MKKALQFSGLIAAVLAIVSFILLLTTPALNYTGALVQGDVDGAIVLFGQEKSADFIIFSATSKTNPSVTALIAWILVIVAVLGLIVGFVLPMAKKDLGKAAGMLNLCAAICLVVAGILLFFTVPTFVSANSNNGSTDGWTLLGGWVVAAILAIVAGACALAPTIANFVSKK